MWFLNINKRCGSECWAPRHTSFPSPCLTPQIKVHFAFIFNGRSCWCCSARSARLALNLLLKVKCKHHKIVIRATEHKEVTAGNKLSTSYQQVINQEMCICPWAGNSENDASLSLTGQSASSPHTSAAHCRRVWEQSDKQEHVCNSGSHFTQDLNHLWVRCNNSESHFLLFTESSRAYFPLSVKTTQLLSRKHTWSSQKGMKIHSYTENTSSYLPK